MNGVNRLYHVIYGARPSERKAFFLGNITREDPIEITAYDLPVPNIRLARGIPEYHVGDEALGVFVGDEAYIIAIM